MPMLSDRVLDNGLTVMDTEANRLDICSQEPATFAAATSTYTLGNKLSPSISAPEDATSGRKAVVSAITDGSVTATGTATHYAITDTVNSRLLSAGPLAASQVVTAGNEFSLPQFDAVTFPDPA